MPAQNPIVKHSGGEEEATVYVYGDTAKLSQYFSAGALSIVALGVVSTQNLSVASHSRRRYPGGKTATVGSHVRSVRRGDTERSGSAQPGNKFWCEYTYEEGSVTKRVVNQFTYQGDWKDLRALAAAYPARNYTLRNSSGAKKEVID